MATKPQLILTSADDEDSCRLNSGSSMSNGVVTITKKIYFRVPAGANPRQYSDLDVYSHPNFPQSGSALAQDARYIFRGNASIKHDLDDGKIFTAELEYTTDDPNATDSQGNPVDSDTPPWRLRPSEIRFSYPEKNIPFQASYNATGQLYTEARDLQGRYWMVPVLPVANTAGDPFALETTVRILQMSFTFAVRKWDVSWALKYGNSINTKSIKVCGLTIPARRAILLPPEASYVTTYKDNSAKVKWQYWNINANIQIDTSGLWIFNSVLNVGDRAFFSEAPYSDSLVPNITLPASVGAEQICRFRKFIVTDLGNGQYNFAQMGENVFCSWAQFLAFRGAAIAASNWLSQTDTRYQGGLVDPQCEQLSQMPLIASTGSDNGHLDVAAIQTGRYASLAFRQYPMMDWSTLNLPTKGINW